MRAEYGSNRVGGAVHAVGYDGKWLCGGKHRYDMECSDGLECVSCTHCLKKLPVYLFNFALKTSSFDDLKKALKSTKALVERVDGDDSNCAVDGIDYNTGLKLYLNSWVIPLLERVVKYYEEGGQRGR